MKKCFILFSRSTSLLLTTLLAFTALAHGASTTTYYVSPTGNNTNGGTESDPFQTISRAIQAASDGDSIVLRNGTYNESIFLGNWSPTDLTFQGHPGENPVVATSPGSPVASFSGAQGIQVQNIAFQNGVVEILNNSSNIGFQGCTFESPQGYSMVTVRDSTSVNIKQCRFDNGRFTTGISITGDSDDVQISGCEFVDNYSPDASVQAVIFIEGQTPVAGIHVENNHFHWTGSKEGRPVIGPGNSAGVIWVQNCSGGTMSDPTIVFTGNSIEDYRFRGTNDDQWYNPAYLKTPEQGGEQGNAFSILNSSGVKVSNNSIRRVSAYGVNAFLSTHLRIENNIFRDCGKSGIFLVGNQATGTGAAPNWIAGNRIHNCGWLKGGTSGVSTIFTGPGNVIANNFISGQRNGTASTVGSDWYGDGNGILADLDSPGTIIIGNVVVHNEGAGISMNRSSDSVVIHNTVIGNGSMPHRSDNCGVFIAGGEGGSDNITVVNNLIYNNRLAQFWVWMTALDHTVRHNLYAPGPLTVPGRQNQVIDWFGNQYNVGQWQTNPPLPGNGAGSIGQRPIFLGDLVGGDPMEDFLYYLPVNGSAGTGAAEPESVIKQMIPDSDAVHLDPAGNLLGPDGKPLLPWLPFDANIGALEAPTTPITQGWMGSVTFAHSTPNSAHVWSTRLEQFLQLQNGGTSTEKLGTVSPMGQDDWLISSRFGFLYAGTEANPTSGWMWTERFGWMKFVDGYLWANHLETWFDVQPNENYHSFDFGFFNPIGGSMTRYNTRIGAVTANADVPKGWLASDNFGFVWFARDGTGVWFWSTNRNEWIGILPDGSLWSTAEGRFLD